MPLFNRENLQMNRAGSRYILYSEPVKYVQVSDDWMQEQSPYQLSEVRTEHEIFVLTCSVMVANASIEAFKKHISNRFNRDVQGVLREYPEWFDVLKELNSKNQYNESRASSLGHKNSLLTRENKDLTDQVSKVQYANSKLERYKALFLSRKTRPKLP